MFRKSLSIFTYLLAAKASIFLVLIDFHAKLPEISYVSITMAWSLVQLYLALMGQPLLLMKLSPSSVGATFNSIEYGFGLFAVLIGLGIVLIPSFDVTYFLVLLLAAAGAHKIAIYSDVIASQPVKALLFPLFLHLAAILSYLLTRRHFDYSSHHIWILATIYLVDYPYFILWKLRRKPQRITSALQIKRTAQLKNWTLISLASNAIAIINIVALKILTHKAENIAATFALGMQLRAATGLVSTALNQQVVQMGASVSTKYQKLNHHNIFASVVTTAVACSFALIYLAATDRILRPEESRMLILMVVAAGPIMYYSTLNSAIFTISIRGAAAWSAGLLSLSVSIFLLPLSIFWTIAAWIASMLAVDMLAYYWLRRKLR